MVAGYLPASNLSSAKNTMPCHDNYLSHEFPEATLASMNFGEAIVTLSAAKMDCSTTFA